ncbi:MAG: isocitrate lyase [Chlamydiia bacterium]|nr:isocitrate lyase [Chlamydiia bacterium]
MYNNDDIKKLEKEWSINTRWKGIERGFSAEDVVKLRGSIQLDHTLARMGAEKLWRLLHEKEPVCALGAMTGLQAVEEIQAGLKAIYVSGWQIAGDMNDQLETYPDQSLYPVSSGPQLIRRINNALIRMDQIEHAQNKSGKDWLAPIVADAEAGFGGPLNTFELIKAMIREGASGVHLEDQLSSLKKCGHMGGKVLVPAHEFIEKLRAARLASDVMGVPTLIIARTDAQGATYIRSDDDPTDQPFLTGKRSSEGFFELKNGTDYAIKRALSYCPFADLIWCETSTPDLEQAKAFAKGIHEKYPGKLLAYNCSPSFNWKKNLGDKEMLNFHKTLADLGYKFQFITLAGFHTLNASMFELAARYKEHGMKAYSDFQEHEFELANELGYTAVKHQSYVGAGYFDEVTMVLSQGQSSTTALKGSTEEHDFS